MSAANRAGRLEGKIALISGGARGIGECTARLFVEEGASVVMADLLDDEGKRLADELGERARYVHLDVRDRDAWDGAVAECTSAFGAPDILVADAGVMIVGMIETITEEHFRRAFEVNVLGCFFGIQSVIAPMRSKGGGSIVVLSSLSGMLMGTAGLSAYAASKSANAALARCAAMELGHYGIRVNSIHPGGIDTPMSNGPQFDGMDKVAPYKNLPIARIGVPEEIARTIAFLSSDESSYTTGTEVVVDGGMHAGPTIHVS